MLLEISSSTSPRLLRFDIVCHFTLRTLEEHHAALFHGEQNREGTRRSLRHGGVGIRYLDCRPIQTPSRCVRREVSGPGLGFSTHCESVPKACTLTWLLLLYSYGPLRTTAAGETLSAYNIPKVCERFSTLQTPLIVSPGSLGVGSTFSLASPARRSLSSSGVPFLHAQASTNRRVSRSHSLFMRSSRTGTKMMIRTGKAGAALVKVTMKITIVITTWTTV